MSKVGNNENPVKNEPSYPGGNTNQWQNDEIDLVDLWIVIWSYRKLILSSVIVIAVIGILGFELLYDSKPASTVRSEIGIESIISDGKHVPIVDIDVLIKRIQHGMLPSISSLSQYKQIKRLIKATKVSRTSKNSNIVRIVSEVETRDTADLSRFHGELVDSIMLELKNSAELLKADFRDTLILLKGRIVNLEAMIITLERDLLGEVNSQVTSDQVLQNQIALQKNNIQLETDLLSERVKYLELSLANEGSHVLLKARVSKNTGRFTKPVVYTMIFMLSVFLALFLIMGVIFARKVKVRMAAAE